MANVLKREKQETILKCLVDGNSIRATERITEVHRDTIMRFMVRVGEGCAKVMDSKMIDLDCKRIEVDEIWGFIGKKQRHLLPADDTSRLGDVWTFVAIDADTKLIPTYMVGKRDLGTATTFLNDLSSRLVNRIQLSSDALSAYVEAVEEAFGADVDYAQIVKSYEAEPAGAGRYSPPKVTDIRKKRIVGKPNAELISTSYVERQNLTMRMSMRRLTRLTNGFSKKIENHKAATALHFAYYNLVRTHKSLRITPAMAAGIESGFWSIGELLDAATSN